MVLGGNVLITGGTGFLGRAILARAAREHWSAQFTIFSRDEQRQALVRNKYPDARYILGDVRNTEQLELLFTGHDIVIHTAAIKFIPEAEFNVSECIDVNVAGSASVIRAARKAGVAFVIGISTDKACAPVNTYGMTKSLMERLFGEASHVACDTHYVCCRYGNVIGSTGSVIPVFNQQLIDNDLVTVTHPRMTRYFITADEAIDIILDSFNIHNGSTIIPTPKAMYTGDLAFCITQDVNKIKTIGLRPGEKMHESLLNMSESVRVCAHGGKFYELLRVGDVGDSREPFELSSDYAARIQAHDMQRYIEDAKYV
jgi:UDP-N-acetylglucosamine 4,6-dehydratase